MEHRNGTATRFANILLLVSVLIALAFFIIPTPFVSQSNAIPMLLYAETNANDTFFTNITPLAIPFINTSSNSSSNTFSSLQQSTLQAEQQDNQSTSFSDYETSSQTESLLLPLGKSILINNISKAIVSKGATQLIVQIILDEHSNTSMQFIANYSVNNYSLVGLSTYCELRENSTGNWSSPYTMTYDALKGEYEQDIYNAGSSFWFQVSCFTQTDNENLSLIDSYAVSKQPIVVALPEPIEPVIIQPLETYLENVSSFSPLSNSSTVLLLNDSFNDNLLQNSSSQQFSLQTNDSIKNETDTRVVIHSLQEPLPNCSSANLLFLEETQGAFTSLHVEILKTTNTTHLLSVHYKDIVTNESLVGLSTSCELRDNSTGVWSAPLLLLYNISTATYQQSITVSSAYWFEVTCTTKHYNESLFISDRIAKQSTETVPNSFNEITIDDLYKPLEGVNSAVHRRYQNDEGIFDLNISQGILRHFEVSNTTTFFFTIDNVTSQPMQATITLPFTLPKNLYFYLWKKTPKGFVQTPYNITSDRKTLQLTLQDGVIDDDGLINKKIVDPLQLVLPTYEFSITKAVHNTQATVHVNNREFVVTTPKGVLDAVALVDPLNLPNLPGTPNSFTHKLVRFTANTTGAEALDVYFTYDSLPPDFDLWKFNSKTVKWYQFPYEQIDAHTIKITIKDGGFGDDDGVKNGIIVDDIGITSKGTQLRIWDLSDTQTIYDFQQNYFYANYTNASTGSSITSSYANCSFTENSTGVWSSWVNMTYNVTSQLYEFHNQTIAGTFMYNISCHSSNASYQNLSLNETFLITHFVNQPPQLINQSPTTHFTTVQEVAFTCAFSDDVALTNISLYLTNATNESFKLNVTTIVSGTQHQTTWCYNLTSGDYTWNCVAWDNNSTVTWANNNSLFVNNPANATYTLFNGRTTNFNAYPDPEAIPDATLDVPAVGKIVWTGTVNATNQEFDSYVNITQNFVSVAVSHLDSSFDSSANITLTNISWVYPVVYRNGVLCSACTLQAYSEGNLTFNVSGFSNYTTAEGTNLSLWDSSDSQEIFNDEQNFFYANYTNITSGNPITGGDVYCEFTENSSGTWSSLVNMTYNVSSELYELNKTVIDGLSSFNVSCFTTQHYANLTVSDTMNISRRPTRELFITNITYSSLTPKQGDIVTLFVNTSNTGNETANNFTLQLNISLWNGTTKIYNETLQKTSLNLTAHTTTLYSFNWTAKPGTYIFDAYVDSNFTVTELNETNNTFASNLTVSAWGFQYGLINHTILLGSASNKTLLNWSDSSKNGYLFFYDADSSIDFSHLAALGNGTYDFKEADTALGMTGFSDSIAKLFDPDNNDVADTTANVTIFGSTITDVPTTLSTNASSPFITGIMWDASLGGEYDGTQDLVLVAFVDANKTGLYGTYDYEVRLPTLLQSWKGSNDFFSYSEEFV